MGSSLVDTAGHTMVEVVLSVEKVSALIAEIAQASQEQSAGIGQVNTAIAQMERVVERNASLVEQATDATGAMNAQAEGLLELTRRFRLQDDAQSATGRVTPAALSPQPALPVQPQPIRFQSPRSQPAVAVRKPSRAAASGEWTAF